MFVCKLPFGLSGSGCFQEGSLRIRNQAEVISYICGLRNIPVSPGTPVSSFACVIGDHHCFGDRAAVLSDFEISGIDRKKRRVSFNQMISVTLNRECNSPDPCCKIFVRKWLLWSVRAFERSYGIAFSLFEDSAFSGRYIDIVIIIYQKAELPTFLVFEFIPL